MGKISEHFVEFSKPFIDAAKKVFEQMVFTKISTGKPELKEGTVSYGDVSAVIGISGHVDKNGGKSDFKGQLVISFPSETYVKVANAMLMENHTEYNDEIGDVGAEICNMIMGNAKRDLNKLGYALDMAVPTTISGKNHSLKYPPGVIVVAIPMNSDHGAFYVEICYQD